MEKDFGLGYEHLLSPTLNLSEFPYTNGCLNMEPALRYPHAVEDSALRSLPLIPDYGFQHKPHLQQVFDPVMRSASKVMFPVGQSDVGQQTGTVPSQKRFLVFDQSGDKTTLLYSARLHTPVHFGACRVPNPPMTHYLSKEERNCYYPLRPSLILNDENDSRDEMHEDTEELDALLCSDDENDSFEDDEASTAHSPSTMTENGTPKLVEESGEEVNSFWVPWKRQKLLHGGDEVASNRYAASELESDAESSKEALHPLSGCKRSRRDEIREAVSILQGIIPDGNGKDAIVVIDEAIQFLRSLKMKAKSLGLDAI